MKNTVSRKDFINRIIRTLLFMVLALISIILGTRVASGNNCNGCPGNGICKGETDCTRFLSDSYGQEGNK